MHDNNDEIDIFSSGQIGHMTVHDCQRRLNNYQQSQQEKMAFEFFVTSMAQHATTNNSKNVAAADDFRIKVREEHRQ